MWPQSRCIEESVPHLRLNRPGGRFASPAEILVEFFLGGPSMPVLCYGFAFGRLVKRALAIGNLFSGLRLSFEIFRVSDSELLSRTVLW